MLLVAYMIAMALMNWDENFKSGLFFNILWLHFTM